MKYIGLRTSIVDAWLSFAEHYRFASPAKRAAIAYAFKTGDWQTWPVRLRTALAQLMQDIDAGIVS